MESEGLIVEFRLADELISRAGLDRSERITGTVPAVGFYFSRRRPFFPTVLPRIASDGSSWVSLPARGRRRSRARFHPPSPFCFNELSGHLRADADYASPPLASLIVMRQGRRYCHRTASTARPDAHQSCPVHTPARCEPSARKQRARSVVSRGDLTSLSARYSGGLFLLRGHRLT